MDEEATGSSFDDIAYLTRSEHRAPTLIALTVRPRSRSELWEMTGASESTIRRTLTEFEKRQWIRRNKYKYEATRLGKFVASTMAELIERFETEKKLREVWQWLPSEADGFTVEMCTGAEITPAKADDPNRPVNRLLSLVRETDRLRFVGFDVALLEPCKKQLCEAIVDGVETEIIEPPRVNQYVRSSCPELFSEALASGNLTLRLHDDLPSFGVAIFDDRVAIVGYDPDSVAVRVLVDTDAPEARDWAESMYATYQRQTPIVPVGSIEQ